MTDHDDSYAYVVANGSLTAGAEPSVSCVVPDDCPVASGTVDLVRPCAASPDGEMVAVGALRRDEYSFVAYDVAILKTTAPDVAIARIERSRSQYVSAIAWSPDGKLFAVLAIRERLGKSPLAMLAALSGHPVQHQDFQIEFYGLDGRRIGRTQYIRGFVGAHGKLCWSS